MIEDKNGITVITCDKCGIRRSASTVLYNDVFFDEGWALYPGAKKYIHLCRYCQTRKERRLHDFVAKNFNG